METIANNKPFVFGYLCGTRGSAYVFFDLDQVPGARILDPNNTTRRGRLLVTLLADGLKVDDIGLQARLDTDNRPLLQIPWGAIYCICDGSGSGKTWPECDPGRLLN